MQIIQNCYKRDMMFEGDWTEEEMKRPTESAYASIGQQVPRPNSSTSTSFQQGETTIITSPSSTSNEVANTEDSSKNNNNIQQSFGHGIKQADVYNRHPWPTPTEPLPIQQSYFYIPKSFLYCVIAVLFLLFFAACFYFRNSNHSTNSLAILALALATYLLGYFLGNAFSILKMKNNK